jgi:hypothetical protein
LKKHLEEKVIVPWRNAVKAFRQTGRDAVTAFRQPREECRHGIPANHRNDGIFVTPIRT